MPFITRWQFVEWSPAMLAVELTRGFVPHFNLSVYIGDKSPTVDIEHVQKLKMIIKVVNLGGEISLPWITKMEKNLPKWAFEELMTLVIQSVDHERLIGRVRKVDTLVFLISRKVPIDFSGVNWRKIGPVSQIRKLHNYIVGGSYGCIPRYILSICDCKLDTKMVIFSFQEVSRVLKYGTGNTPGIWQPIEFHHFDGIRGDLLDQMLTEGWILVMHFSYYPAFKNYILDVVIRHRRSYFLFDEKYFCGRFNRKQFIGDLSEDTINSMVDADKKNDPVVYNNWTKDMDGIEF